jgi:hypothetical protein
MRVVADGFPGAAGLLAAQGDDGVGDPPGRPGSRTRAAKVRAGTREVTTDRRYGGRRHTRRHPNGRNPGDVWSIPRPPLGGPFHDRPASSAFSYSKANSS